MTVLEDQALAQEKQQHGQDVPDKTRTAIYEIFVDRFADDNGLELTAPPPGSSPSNHHCGGTLQGIASRLDHIHELGFDAIYLTPIFQAQSNHKYNTSSFHEIDSRFGGEAAFSDLANECRLRGMGLILDGVFNHVGTDHTWFQQSEAHDDEGVIKRNGTGEYSCWRGHKTLPELNLNSPQVQHELFDSDNAVIRKWIRRGATGWRLDCANDLGRSVCAKARLAVQEEKAPDGVTGEVMAYAEDWLAGEALDGIMNYYFRETVLSLVQQRVPVVQAAYNLKRMARRYKRSRLLRSWNLLSSHDTPRLATEVPDKNKRRIAQVLAFAYPGIPMVYYGDEIGMQGGPDPDCRNPMLWDPAIWDTEMMELVLDLTALRNTHPALQTGEYLPMPQPGHPNILAFARTTAAPQELVLAIVNGSDKEFSGKLFVPYSYLFDGLPLRDLLEKTDTVIVSSGSLQLNLPPWSIALFTPDDSIPGHSFFGGHHYEPVS